MEAERIWDQEGFQPLSGEVVEFVFFRVVLVVVVVVAFVVVGSVAVVVLVFVVVSVGVLQLMVEPNEAGCLSLQL